MYLLLLLAQNLPTELQVCPHPQTHRVGVFWGLKPGGLAVSQVKILLLAVLPNVSHFWKWNIMLLLIPLRRSEVNSSSPVKCVTLLEEEYGVVTDSFGKEVR